MKNAQVAESSGAHSYDQGDWFRPTSDTSLSDKSFPFPPPAITVSGFSGSLFNNAQSILLPQASKFASV
jgi:hypothetical protein